MTSPLSQPLTDQVIVVVGATKGIGAAIAQGLASQGARVVVAGRDVDGAAATVQRIVANGGQAQEFRCDVTSDADCSALASFVKEHHGKLDTVFANQGVAGPALPLTQWPDVDINACLDVNLLGCLRLARANEQLLADDDGGRMIVTGSGSGYSNSRGLGMYGISKAAVSHLVRQLSIEWRSRSIAVNELVPGPVRTAMTGFDEIKPTNSPNPMETYAARSGEWLKDPDDLVPLAQLLATLPTNGPSGQTYSLAGRLL